MLTEMALSSDRMRFKDKIIANIAKAIKGIQEAVFFKAQTTTDSSPLILRNNDRQCHKLCENLDHVFLHGLRHHSHGYWKVVTEYTHKNAVREIQNLRNVTTDLGRGRAWIFMALNDSLLESYIRCVTEHTKTLKKHYAKDALLLDQQQMSVLLTLTSGLECAVFQLEYDLPYLDLTAYPPRTRTASEVEEEEAAAHVKPDRSVAASSRPSSETAASTPESTKALTDSDTASLSSLDTTALRSARVSSVSMDSGFPGDMISIQSNKQRSVTPIDTLSISSHGSAGEPDRLTRLENIVTRTDETDEMDGGGLEVIRLKGGKKSSSGAKKKKASLTKKGVKGSYASQAGASVSAIGSAGLPSSEACHNPTAPIKITNSSSADSLQDRSVGKSPPFKNSPFGKSPQYGKSPCRKNSQMGRSPPIEEIASAGSNSSGENAENTSPDGIGSTFGEGEEMESSAGSSGLAREVERLTAETKDSLADRFAQLDTTVASIRATATSLHQHPEQGLHLGSSSETAVGHSVSQMSSLFQNAFPHTSSIDVEGDDVSSSAIACDIYNKDATTVVPEQNETVPASVEDSGNQKSALEELESKCAQLCRPLSPEDFGCGSHDVLASDSTSRQDIQNSTDAQSNQESASQINDVKCGDDGETSSRLSLEQVNGEEEEEVDFYSAPDKVGVRSNNNTTHCYNQLHDYMDYISGHHQGDKQRTGDEVVVEVDMEGNMVETETESRDSDWNKDYALKLDNNTKLQIMLDIFTNGDEDIMKMFVSREGHSEGDQKVTFVLITNLALYLLKQRDLDRKFESELAIPLKDLSFISLSLNKQIVNIESSGPNRRKERIWLTPGDHLLAQQMLDCLEEAMKNVEHPTSVRSRFSVGSDEPLQIIALRKYIARDSNCEEQDVEIEDYSLVFWEDAQSNKNKQTFTAREGTMLLRVNDPFKGHTWKPVYVVLRDFMLCLFANKTDSKPQHYVRLGGEQCVGCRLATTQDRPHCIEIILATGGSWFLSVASKEEVASWRQSLCLAVSEGVQDSSNLSCFPCVSVVTGQKLLLCHEDVQTKFCRTIASAKVEEITAVAVDSEVNKYCVIEFESQEKGVSSERWVLYFNAPLEMDRFVQALSKVWHQVYQIPLTPGSIEDLPLQKHCQDQVFLLERAMSMK